MTISLANDEDSSDSAFLYRCFNSDFALLYVGVTMDVKTRMRHHSSKSLWFPMMQVFTVEEFGDRTIGENQERMAIANERPMFNVRHKSDWPTLTTISNRSEQESQVSETTHEQMRMFLQTANIQDIAIASGVHRRTLEKIRAGWHESSPWTLARLQPVIARLNRNEAAKEKS